MLTDKIVLLVGAHPDDIEIGCGGTISKYRGKMKDLSSVIFAPCLEDPANEGILAEYHASMKRMGTTASLDHRYARDVLESNIQDIRDILHMIKESDPPDVVFCPSINDLHQDHRAVASACKTIFRDSSTLLSYEVVRSTVDFLPSLYVRLGLLEVIEKQELMALYVTQKRRTYWNPKLTSGTARYGGAQAGVTYAEAFEVWRMIDP